VCLPLQWDYLIGEAPGGEYPEPKDSGLMAKFFDETWYNGDAIDPTESGFVLGHNKVY
jgi:hypothetical protein